MLLCDENIWFLHRNVHVVIYTIASLKKTFVPKLNVDVTKTPMKPHRYVRTWSQSEVDKQKPFLLTDNYYDTINYGIIGGDVIEYDVVQDNEN